MQPLSLYIGYDSGSDAAYQVAARSAQERSSIPVNVVRLELGWLRRIGLYTRPWFDDGGQPRDGIDGRPFSTDFSFSRFLVPSLHPRGWCVFCDQDFMFRRDLADLTQYFDDRYACMVVKHDYEPQHGTKMRGQVQQPYARKNWSSFVAWNCDHPATQALAPELVNRMPGRWLHGFSWLWDDAIGDLPAAWNWLDGHSASDDPSAVHFTRGTPDMPGWEETQYAEEWREVLNGCY